MAKRILPKQPIFFTAEEFVHCWPALRMISNRAGNLERIFESASGTFSRITFDGSVFLKSKSRSKPFNLGLSGPCGGRS